MGNSPVGSEESRAGTILRPCHTTIVVDSFRQLSEVSFEVGNYVNLAY